MTQYDDQNMNGMLEMEGKTNHTADNRIIDAVVRNDEIHLFYRARHHSPFVYYGLIHLIAHERHTDTPSRFRFSVPSEHPDDSLETELLTYGRPNEEFVPDAEGRRIGNMLHASAVAVTGNVHSIYMVTIAWPVDSVSTKPMVPSTPEVISKFIM